MKTFKINGETFRVGDEVVLDVRWKDGRTSSVRGKLITVDAGEAFVESDLGAVVGDPETLERA